MSIHRDLDLEAKFPNLRAAGYAVTSDAVDVPNCIAWVVGDMDHYWDPQLAGFSGTYYWPPGIRRDDSIDALVDLFELFGYRVCDDGRLEFGFERIVIYADRPGEPAHESQHVARQLRSGAWTSKLGPGKDIEHQT